jgi:hypothetical protein
MGVSNSSETMVPVRPQSERHDVNTSLAIRSSFFCSSPEALLSPASPIMPEMGARATSDEICRLHAPPASSAPFACSQLRLLARLQATTGLQAALKLS